MDLVKGGDRLGRCDAVGHFGRPAHARDEGRVDRAVSASERQVTVFKSVGLAVEDLIVARAIADVLSDTDKGTAPAEHGQAR